MTQPSAFFLTPEQPAPGGGGLRSACMLAYLRDRYRVEVATFKLAHHSKTTAARTWRNGLRLIRGRPPLLDRYSGYEDQLELSDRYSIGLIEHFWCAPYARVLRPHCDRLVLDLHNVESELAGSHARATRGLESLAFSRFAESYRRLEREWLPQFDIVLVASEQDRARVTHPRVHVVPNALPEIPRPTIAEANCVVFSGNLEYHPNVEAVRWFRERIWPAVRASGVEWRLVGRNAHAVESIVTGDDRIKLTGSVDDAIASIAKAKVCVVPLLSGSGTRFKILEAWAAARAVVSTSIGAEGLGARPGEHLLIADDPEKFSQAVVQLLKDPDLRAKLGEAGRKFFVENYTWTAAWRALDEALT